MLFVFASGLNSLHIGLKKSFHSLFAWMCYCCSVKSAVADAPVYDLDNDTNTDLSLVNDLDTLTLRLEFPVIVCI